MSQQRHEWMTKRKTYSSASNFEFAHIVAFFDLDSCRIKSWQLKSHVGTEPISHRVQLTFGIWSTRNVEEFLDITYLFRLQNGKDIQRNILFLLWENISFIMNKLCPLLRSKQWTAFPLPLGKETKKVRVSDFPMAAPTAAVEGQSGPIRVCSLPYNLSYQCFPPLSLAASPWIVI